MNKVVESFKDLMLNEEKTVKTVPAVTSPTLATKPHFGPGGDASMR